ncbi:titin-like [Sabethes cyaneus]|uniref:titin-like n=1 Tax=Sabethes cyaneus TaxID=53552 RepID=UPI00237E6386|nr:titin-like [Sabethes cyaneus]
MPENPVTNEVPRAGESRVNQHEREFPGCYRVDQNESGREVYFDDKFIGRPREPNISRPGPDLAPLYSPRVSWFPTKTSSSGIILELVAVRSSREQRDRGSRKSHRHLSRSPLPPFVVHQWAPTCDIQRCIEESSQYYILLRSLTPSGGSASFRLFLVLSAVLALALGAALEKPAQEAETAKETKTSESAKVQGKRGLEDFGYGSEPILEGGFKPSFGYDTDGHGASDRLFNLFGKEETHHTVIKAIPVPYTVEKHVVHEKKVPVPVDNPVPYPVTVERKVPVYIEKKVPVHVDRPVPYPVKVPYPVTVEKKVPVYIEKKVHVDRPVPYPVHVEKEVPVYVEKKVPVYIEKKVPVHVEVKVPVVQRVEVPVPKPYPVHVPKPYPVYIEKEVIKHVDRPVTVEVEKKVPVPVVHKVEVPKPYPVYVDKPVYIEKHESYPHHQEEHYVEHSESNYIHEEAEERQHNEEQSHQEESAHDHQEYAESSPQGVRSANPATKPVVEKSDNQQKSS